MHLNIDVSTVSKKEIMKSVRGLLDSHIIDLIEYCRFAQELAGVEFHSMRELEYAFDLLTDDNIITDKQINEYIANSYYASGLIVAVRNYRKIYPDVCLNQAANEVKTIVEMFGQL